MSALILTLVIGVGLGALYFLVASGLSLIYGLMHVLNFAHGAFLTAGAYAAWVAMGYLSGLGGWAFPLAIIISMGCTMLLPMAPFSHSALSSAGPSPRPSVPRHGSVSSSRSWWARWSAPSLPR